MSDEGPVENPKVPRMAVVPEGGEASAGETTIEQPGKLLRIASMLRELIEEVQRSSLDEPARDRLREIYERSVSELGESLSEDLRQELAELAPPLERGASESEVRVAQAQLLGWLEGLFHGIQAALWTQQMQARAALEEMRRRSLPSGSSGPPGERPPEGPHPPGQYL
jgi:hypothetical protein